MRDDDDQIHPVINVEETIGKTVGRRKPRRGLTLEGSRKSDMIAWRKAFGGVGIPKGVFRFHSHEEADQWMIQQLATTAAKRS
mgnify:CR=1 FL=1